MRKWKVKVIGVMEFEVESESEHGVNDEATYYVDNNLEEFDWYFDHWEEVSE